jgi:hypothetical protein
MKNKLRKQIGRSYWTIGDAIRMAMAVLVLAFFAIIGAVEVLKAWGLM